MRFEIGDSFIDLAPVANVIKPSLMFVGEARSLPRVEHLKGDSLGLAPALTANNRLGWKGLPGTNALAYCEKL